tara:strand:- start:15 stop:509 length:495 start_codon:yes stop_codon:yes gene_type:complete
MANGQGDINVDVDSGNNTKFIVYGIVALVVLPLAYFGVINPLLKFLQIKDTKEEKKGKKDAESLDRKQVLSSTLYKNNRSKRTITSGQANTKARNIYKGKGLWDDETKAVGAITSAGSLVNVSYIAYTFNNLYGSSMMSYMTQNYLEPENWTEIDNYIAKAKKF